MLLDKSLRRIAGKELSLFFSSPIGYLFLAVFVSATLFIFFWVESFFSRNIADVRPMFEWMPILLIILSAALTMRMWSEERRSGTLEHVLTLPLSPWQFVLGKFAACKTLLAIALALTLPLPITVSIMGDLDWGPVISGYIATMLLGSAYISIGLYVSARSDNQIVSLIVTVLVCGAFYLIGSSLFTNLVGNQTGEIFRALGSGSRFESITRGVLDLRDLYYYVAIIAIFLTLNRYSLEKERWANNAAKPNHFRWKLATGLAIANFVVASLWLSPLGSLRVDLTEGKIYSISNSTRGYLKQLREPLLIRGYFSEKTHPLLAPLVPQLQDLLKEYQVEGEGNIRVEFVDPAQDAEAEEEAGSKYGIRPVPFRVADRYQSAVVNSYFNLLVQYGDEYKVISFRELIDVKTQGTADIDVQLRNPEYDVTNAIKQVLYAYQSGGNLFDSIRGNLSFTAYISNEGRLPKSLAEFVPTLKSAVETIKKEAGDKLAVNFVDPDANNGQVAQEIAEKYGFQPMASSLFDTNTFYFYMLLDDQETAVQIPIPDDFSEDAFKRGLDAGLKRFASGFTKSIGIVAPEQNPYAAQMGQPHGGASFNLLQQVMNENMTSKSVDLSSGKVPEDIDLLMVLAPENLDDKSVFAIDQFLMQGGTVVAATSPLKAELSQQSLSAQANHSGLEAWLAHQGIKIGSEFVMDKQNAAFPMPVTRQVGMFSVQEMRMLDYPYFLEVRQKGLNEDNQITSGMRQLTVPWASPITLDAEKNQTRQVVELVNSSPASWLDSSTNISPQMDNGGVAPFKTGELKGEQQVAVAITGRFSSYFADKTSPLLITDEDDATETPEANTEEGETEEPEEIISSVIEKSSEAARLILISSNSFAEDRITSMLSSINGNNYSAPLQFLTNAAEWSLDDQGLASIRSRGHFNRTLPPLESDDQKFWEILNYILALLGVIVVYLILLARKKSTHARYQALLTGGAQA